MIYLLEWGVYNQLDVAEWEIGMPCEFNILYGFRLFIIKLIQLVLYNKLIRRYIMEPRDLMVSICFETTG